MINKTDIIGKAIISAALITSIIYSHIDFDKFRNKPIERVDTITDSLLVETAQLSEQFHHIRVSIETFKEDSAWIHNMIMMGGTRKYRMYAGEWANLFVREARNANVNPRILAAVAYTESRFNPFAVGETGDHGMFQLVPLWWYNIYRRECGYWNPYNVEMSVCYAAHILNKYVKRYGDVRVALAAWNSGLRPTRRGYQYARLVLKRSGV